MKKSGFISVVVLILVALMALVYSTALAAPSTKTDDGISVFNGKWVSTHFSGGVLTAQSLHIQCNKNKNTCRMQNRIERSGTCSSLYGDPTGLKWTYNGPVDFDGSTISTAQMVDLYCLSKPPSFLDSLTAWYTYNEINDTLTDFGATWYRK